jgi:hypothetical protein
MPTNIQVKKLHPPAVCSVLPDVHGFTFLSMCNNPPKPDEALCSERIWTLPSETRERTENVFALRKDKSFSQTLIDYVTAPAVVCTATAKISRDAGITESTLCD